MIAYTVKCSMFYDKMHLEVSCQNDILFVFRNFFSKFLKKRFSKESQESEIIFDRCQEISRFKLCQFLFNKISNKLRDTNSVIISLFQSHVKKLASFDRRRGYD